MLDATKAKLAALYAGGEHRGAGGKFHAIDPITRIVEQQGTAIAAIHRTLRPRLSVEVGLAYGYSALFILDAMKEGGYGCHIAIDPFQLTLWHGIGLTAVREAGLARRCSGRFRWIRKRSALALSELIHTRTRAQFVYIDGSHLFDDALIDFSLADKILDVGGVILLDDLWMPAIQRVVAFISRNMACYERFDSGHEINLAAFSKTSWDERPWDHYVEF